MKSVDKPARDKLKFYANLSMYNSGVRLYQMNKLLKIGGFCFLENCMHVQIVYQLSPILLPIMVSTV